MSQSSGKGPVKGGAGRLGGGPPSPALASLLAVAVILAGMPSCNNDSPTELNLATPTPTGTPTPAPPPTPTPFPDASDIVLLTHDFPPVIHRGQEVTFTVTIVGKTAIGQWDKALLQFYFGYPFPSALKFLSYEGERIGITPVTGETGGWGIMLWGGAFTTGSRLSFTARIVVDLNARIGFIPLRVEADLENDVKEHRSRFQQFNLMTQIVQ